MLVFDPHQEAACLQLSGDGGMGAEFLLGTPGRQRLVFGPQCQSVLMHSQSARISVLVHHDAVEGSDGLGWQDGVVGVIVDQLDRHFPCSRMQPSCC